MFHKKLSLWRRLVGSHEQYLLTPKIKYTYLLNDTKSLVEQKKQERFSKKFTSGWISLLCTTTVPNCSNFIIFWKNFKQVSILEIRSKHTKEYKQKKELLFFNNGWRTFNTKFSRQTSFYTHIFQDRSK